MILILLTILVGIVPSESSFINSDYKVNNDHCIYSEVKLQTFKEITNSSLRSFLLRKLGEIANTDCVHSYQAKIKNDSSPFYVFLIDRQTKFLRRFTVCGVVTGSDGDFMWTACDKTKFKNYLVKCESEVGPETRHPQVPPVLSCNQTPTPLPRVSLPINKAPPTPAPRLNPPNKVTPPTPAPRVNPPNKDVPPTPAPRLNPPNKVTPPTPAPVNPPNKDVPPTPAPRNLTHRVVTPTIPPRAAANEKSTTRKGWLSKLNCFSCV